MNKKKCYVLIVSRYFPKTHKRSGQETNFIKHILNGVKKHTIRMNFDLWESRVKEIDQGRAYVSIRYWEGKPYRSKQIEVAKFYDLGLQKLQKSMIGWCIDNYDSELTTGELAKNDGLTGNDFRGWFKEIPEEALAILHFTNFRYKNSKNTKSSLILK